MTRRSRNRAAQPDPIAAQYNQWVYPRPLDDLAAQPGRQAADPALTHRIYWPDRADPGPLDILVAGCGANQAAEIAFHNRSARVVGIDVSDAALAHERVLKDKHQLANLETLKLPVEAAARLGHQFDLVIATGVLHHLVDPVAGLKALGDCLKRDGAVVSEPAVRAPGVVSLQGLGALPGDHRAR